MVEIIKIRKTHNRCDCITHFMDACGGISTKEMMIDFIERNGGGRLVYVRDQSNPSQVVFCKVVNTFPKYIRTERDGQTDNNLLSLPEF